MRTPEEKLVQMYAYRQENWQTYCDTQKSLMTKRRKQGLTQKSNREYGRRNRLAIQLYAILMSLDKRLVRKGHKAYNRRAE